MTEEQKLRYDLLKECGYDIDKARNCYEFIMSETHTTYVADGAEIVQEEGATTTAVPISEEERPQNAAEDKETAEPPKDWRDEYDYVGAFYDGRAMVRKNGKYNYFVTLEGKILCDEWYDGVGYFSDGRAMVKKDGKYNFITLEGKPLCDEWFDNAWGFRDGRAMVEKDGKKYHIDINGKRIEE